TLARSNPQRHGKWLYSYNEVYVIADLVVQYYCLKQFGGSMAENFYGLERVSANCEEKGRKFLKAKDRYWSILFLVVIPYIRRKVEIYFREWRLCYADGILREGNWKDKFKVILVKLYPWIYFISTLSSLILLLKYSVSRSKYPSLSLLLSGVHLVRASGESMAEWEMKKQINWKSGILNVVPTLLALGTKWMLEFGAFGLQFAEWWMASGSAPFSAIAALPVPDFPNFEFKEKLCPLCKRLQDTPTLLPISG
ncbi:hypothetical protein QYM36_012114, partial [Artemia franciscana]